MSNKNVLASKTMKMPRKRPRTTRKKQSLVQRNNSPIVSQGRNLGMDRVSRISEGHKPNVVKEDAVPSKKPFV